jgi:hypothetical protein
VVDQHEDLQELLRKLWVFSEVSLRARSGILVWCSNLFRYAVCRLNG